ncbi:hypothetical protein [Geodermatophilus sp. URMC 64]
MVTIPALARPALGAAPAFLLTAAALSVADRNGLRAWGWTPLDHAGVPWPSGLALLPGGWLQTLAFAGTGASLVALAAALPRGGRARLLAACGAGLLAAAFPLDLPDGDPGALASWIHSWPAVVHASGFAVAGLAGILAIAASRRRADVVLAGALAAAAAVGGTPGWYAFLAGFLAWVWQLARRVSRGAGRPAAPSATAARAA